MENLWRSILCPIKHIIPDDPVLATDGYIYSRDALETWLSQRSSSPMTQEHIDPSNGFKTVKAITELCKSLSSRSIQRSANISHNSEGICLLEKSKLIAGLRNLLTRCILKSDGVIFGSNSYQRVLHDKDIISFYIRCKKDELNADMMYHDKTYHPESWNARHRAINDIDVYFKNESESLSFIDSLSERGRQKGWIINHYRDGTDVIRRIRISEGHYANTIFAKNNRLRRCKITVPVGVYGKMSLSMDIVSARCDCFPELKMGWFPNIIKTICRDRYRYFFRMDPDINVDHTLIMLDACKRMFAAKQTLTSVIQTRMIDIHDPVREDDIKGDTLLYSSHLWDEIESGIEILNLSAQSSDVKGERGENQICFKLFDSEQARTSASVHLSQAKLEALIRSSSVSDLRHGRLLYPQEGTSERTSERYPEFDMERNYIYYLKDPDFNILSTEYPEFDYLCA